MNEPLLTTAPSGLAQQIHESTMKINWGGIWHELTEAEVTWPGFEINLRKKRSVAALEKRPWLRRYLRDARLSLLAPYPPQWQDWTLLSSADGSLLPAWAERLILDAWRARAERRKSA